MRKHFSWIMNNRHEAEALRLIKRLFSAVPNRILGRLSGNGVIPMDRRSEAQWHRVTGGPLLDHYLLLDLGSAAAWNIEMKEGCFDAFIYDALSKVATIEGATIWDAGAHIGYHSLSFAALVGPSGSVVAFEPNPHNIERFQHHLERNKDLKERITLMSCALGNMDGEADFVFSGCIDSGRSSGSHLKTSYVPLEPQSYRAFDQKKVSVHTADELLRTNRAPAPSIIKIDVEGAESFLLAGAQHLLRTLRPVLLMEVHHISAMHDTLNILLRLGYHTSILDEASTSSSRCFILARPESNYPMGSVAVRR
jgi:FkbM family methyltransferase